MVDGTSENGRGRQHRETSPRQRLAGSVFEATNLYLSPTLDLNLLNGKNETDASPYRQNAPSTQENMHQS